MSAIPPRLFYTEADSERALTVWRAQCGPHSLAAACGMTLDQIRPVLRNYRGWMNPTMMGESLVALGRRFRLTSGLKTLEVCNGISRVQWEGPWLNPGVPPAVAYRYTHWVAHLENWVLCTATVNDQWIPADEWRMFHLARDPVAPFHVTHHYAFTDLTPGREHDFDALPLRLNELRSVVPPPPAPISERKGNAQLSLSIDDNSSIQ